MSVIKILVLIPSYDTQLIIKLLRGGKYLQQLVTNKMGSDYWGTIMFCLVLTTTRCKEQKVKLN